MIKLGQLVLKEVNWVHNTKIRSYGLERSQLGTQYKNQFIWSWKESIVHKNEKIRSDGLEKSNLDTQCKNKVIWSWKELIGNNMQNKK